MSEAGFSCKRDKSVRHAVSPHDMTAQCLGFPGRDCWGFCGLILGLVGVKVSEVRKDGIAVRIVVRGQS
eukprot:1096660-Amorphochlora_amoeboformis.AAC.1